MKTKVSIFILSCIMLIMHKQATAQGAGYAQDFSQGSYDYNTPSSITHNIGAGDFTMECWVKPTGIANKGQGVMANGNYSPALYWKTRTDQGGSAGGSVGLYWSSWLNSGAFIDVNTWNHIALVRESDSVSFYVNGVEAPNKFLVTNSVPNSPFTIGNSNDGEPLDGFLDEVRFWSVARTETELRTNMCQKLDTIGVTDLVAYYRFDEGTGTTAADWSGNGNDITATGLATYWTPSGAAIGDVSVYNYPSSWTGQTVSHTSATHGTFTIDNILGNPSGAYVYYINAAPTDSTGIVALNGNDGYFGTYIVENGATASYDYNYDYTSHTNAVALKNNIGLFKRNAADLMWAGTTATNDVSTTTFSGSLDTLGGEFIIGNFLSVCNDPTVLTVQNLSYTSVGLAWTSGGSSIWNIEYGLSGFTQGSGTRIDNVTTNPYTLTGLADSVTYDFYIQDTCLNLGTSNWVGPFQFTTIKIPVCNVPTNVTTLSGYTDVQLSWLTGGSNEWNVEYGPTGFTFGSGTQVSNVANNPYTIGGLNPNSGYDFYIQDTCNQINASQWVGPITATTQTLPVNAQSGSGMGLHYSGANEYLSLGTTINTEIDTNDFAIEWWMKGEAMSSDPSIIGNKDWGSGNNPGFVVARTGSNTIKINAKFTGGGRFDMNNIVVPGLQSDWLHLAIVFDRRSTHPDVKVFVNGVLADSASLASNNPTGAFATPLPLIVGQDGTGTYGAKYKGIIDEVRVWNTSRTENDIRTYMCRKLSGTENGLAAYYSLNEGTGTAAADITSTYPATLVNTPAWVASGAAVGDTSTFLYPLTWTGQSLQLSSLAKGNITVDSIQQTAKGIHIYRIDRVPNGINGIRAIANNNTYYGVFVAEDSSLAYNLTYDYSVYPLAVSNEDSLMIFNRLGGEVAYWNDVAANRIVLTDEIKKSSVTGYRNEFILANFAGFSCSTPSAGTSSNITFNSADLAWTTGGSLIWDIEYDVAGFTVGTGNLVSAINTNPYTLSGLTPSTNYEFYVRDNCGTQGTSSWVGPFSFATMTAPVCPDPTNLSFSNVSFGSADISWTTGGSVLWNVQYGVSGFTLGSGTVIDSVFSNPYTLTGLSASTMYDVYVQDTCNFVNASSWIGPITFTTQTDYRGYGSGIALDVSGTGKAFSNAGKQSAATLGLPDTAITLEAWFKPRSFGQWKSIVSFIQDNGNFERGFDLETRNSNRLGFTLKSAGSSSMTYLETTNSFALNKWYHIAGVYDGDTMKIYVNGILENTSTSQSGDIDYADGWFTIGSYKDDNEDNSVNGEIDEVRVWATARTEDELHQYMCQKLTGNEDGLVSYYTMNEGSGTVLTDLAGSNNLDFQGSLNNSSWVTSGAAIGDTSVYLYDVNYTGKSLSLTTSDRGNVVVDSVSNTPEGIHLYKVNQVPNSTNGISDIGDQNTYYGTFVAEYVPQAVYDVTYEYANYPNATANENFLNLYNRGDNSRITWINTGAIRDGVNDELRLNGYADRREFILSDFMAASCAPSSSITASNIQFFSADVSWTSGSGTDWRVEYGHSGYNLGSGTLQTVSTTPTLSISGLQHSTAYDVYVQDSCTATDQSSWVGPLTFTTLDICPDLDSVTLAGVTGNSASFDFFSAGTNTDWVIQWGPTGFPFGVGVNTTVAGSPGTLQSLVKGTTYDAYFRADCDSIFSDWIGPITFTTDSFNIGLHEYSLEKAMEVYPNPNSGSFTIAVDFNSNYTISLSTVVGEVLWKSAVELGYYEKSFDMYNLPAGVYLVRLQTEKGTVVKKMIRR